MHKAIDHPCVWRGDELLRREDWLHQIDTGCTEELAPVLAAIQRSLEDGCGAAMLRGFRADGDPREVFLALGGMVGTPISQSADGELVFSVRDAGHRDDDPRARGPNTRKKLSYHSDRCDVIGFMCLNQAKSGGENFLVSSAALYNEILARRPDLLEVLMQPFYYLRHTVDTANDKPYCRQPVFSFTGGKLACCLLRVLIERCPCVAGASGFDATADRGPGLSGRAGRLAGDARLVHATAGRYPVPEQLGHAAPAI